MKQQRRKDEEVVVNAIDIACKVSICDALQYIYEEFGGSNYFSDGIFEEILYIEPKKVRNIMYKNLLEKPYIYWLEKFILKEDERAGLDGSVSYKISYQMYNKYSKDEIVTKLVEYLCEKNDFDAALRSLRTNFDDILHCFELEAVWREVVNYYTRDLEDESDIFFILDNLETWGRDCKVGYCVLMEYVIENFEKFIPFLEEAYEIYNIAKVLLGNRKEKEC